MGQFLERYDNFDKAVKRRLLSLRSIEEPLNKKRWQNTGSPHTLLSDNANT